MPRSAPFLCDPSPGFDDAARTHPRPPLTLEQVSLLLGVSPRTARRLIAAGKLRKLPLTRAVRIGFEDLERFLRGEAPAADGNDGIT
jgi:excisionase family DNA binding protein